MSRQLVSIGDLTIASAGTDSNVISTKVGFSALVDLIIYAPAALTGTVTVYVGPLENMDIADMSQLSIGGAAVTISQGTGTVVPAASFRSLAVISTGAEGADRVFVVVGQVDIAV